MNLISPVDHAEQGFEPGSDLVIRVSFFARTGEAYLVQRSHDQQRWVNVLTVPASSGRIIEIAAPRDGAHRFYRAIRTASCAGWHDVEIPRMDSCEPELVRLG